MLNLPHYMNFYSILDHDHVIYQASVIQFECGNEYQTQHGMRPS